MGTRIVVLIVRPISDVSEAFDPLHLSLVQ
jgi:hypothetical protein